MRFTSLFIVLLCLDLIQVYTGGDYRFITKPLIMLSLIGHYTFVTFRYKKHSFLPLFLVALVSALAGDIFLLNSDLFIWGLGSFLIMQLIYIHIFWKDHTLGKRTFIFGAVLLLIIGTVAYMLWPQLGALKIPVLIYMCAIGGMSWTAFSRRRTIPGYTDVFLGTLFFIISDTVLAIHQFDAGLDLGKITVMLTYGIAQYLIVTGIMKAI